MPVSGGDFTGKITAPSAYFGLLSAGGGITLTDAYHPGTFIGYKTSGYPLYITVNNIDAIEIDNLGDVAFNTDVIFRSGNRTDFYSSAVFYNPVKINNKLEVTGNINASNSTISAFNIIGSGTSFFTGVSATSITATNLFGATLYENGQALSSRYLPLSGGDMSGNIRFNYNNVSADNLGIYGFTGSGNDGWRIVGQTVGSDQGALEIATMDNGNEPIYVRQYTNASYATSAIARTLTLLDGGGNTTLPGTLTIGNVVTTGAAQNGVLRIDGSGRVVRDTIAIMHYTFTSAVPVGAGISTVSVVHNLGRKDVSVRVYDQIDGYACVLPDINYSSSTSTTLALNFSIPTSTTMYVVIDS
jgi:hypothetical protein